MKTEILLERWDKFVDQRSLPYYRNKHQVMFRQVLDRFPFRKLGDLSDRDLRDCINLKKNNNSGPNRQRCFRYFLAHFDRFLQIHEIDRGSQSC